MNPILSLDPEFSARFVMTLAHFLWQGAAIGVAVFLLGFVLRRASSRLRYGIFLTALLAMALCPPATYSLIGQGALASPQMDQPPGLREWGAADPFSQPDRTYRTDQTDRTDPSDPSDRAGSVAVADTGTPGEDTAIAAAPPADLAPGTLEVAFAPSAASDWRAYTPYLILAYIAGVLVMLARLALGLAGGGRLRKRAERITDNAILDALQPQAAQLRLRAVPVVAYCQRVAVPTVVGVIRPMILLPASLATGMPPQQVELLLLHELAHIRRYDHVLNIVQRLIEAALFFHPALWYVSHRIRVEREHCCDDLVIALGGERQVYAESLVAAAALASGASLSPVALAATGKPSQLRRRIHRMLGDPQPPVRLVRGGWVLTALVAVALIAGATQLATPAPEDPIAEDAPELVIVPKSAVEESVPEPELQLANVTDSEAQAAAPSEDVSTDTPADAPADVDRTPDEIRVKRDELASQLRDPDWWLRKVAVQQMGELPHDPTLVNSLIAMLKDEDARVQAAAAEALAKQGDPEAVKHLVAALKEESDVREAAAEALTHFEPDEVMPLLTLAARDEDESVCRGAIIGLGKQNTPEATAVLVDLLPRFYGEPAHARVPVRRGQTPAFQLGPLGRQIAEAFGKMDPAIARPALERACIEGDWKGRTLAVLVAGEAELCNDETMQRTLYALLREDRKDLRAVVVRVFSDIVAAQVEAGRDPDSRVLAALVPVLHDPNREIAHTAALALAKASWQPTTVDERAWFLVATGQCDEAADLGSVAFEPLVHALHADLTPAFSISGDTAQVPNDVIEGLRRIDDPRKVEALIDAIQIAPDDTIGWIADSLGETRDPRAVKALVSLLGHLNLDVRNNAASALGRIGDPRAVPPLIELLKDSSGSVRFRAMVALGEIGDPRAAEALRPLLETEYSEFAATALGKIGDVASAAAILKLYTEATSPRPPTSPGRQVTGPGDANAYRDAFEQIGGPVVREGMIQILQQDTNVQRRYDAACVLGKVGGASSVPTLREVILFDPDNGVKTAACKALGQIGGEDAARALEDLLGVDQQAFKYAGLVPCAAQSLSQIENQISSDALARLFTDSKRTIQWAGINEVRLVAAKTLAERGDPRGKPMLEELREIPETRIEATNALQQLEQQSPPDAESAVSGASTAPSGQPGQPGTTDRSDPSDQSTGDTQQTSQLTGPRLQFRWVVEGDEAAAKTILPAPTEAEPDRTLAVGDEVVLYEGGIATAKVRKDPNTNQYAVHFETKERWAERLLNATEQNKGKALAIIFDGRILSAPVVQAAFGKSGAITGSFTQEEAETIAKAIGQGDDKPLPEPFLYDKEQVLDIDVRKERLIIHDPVAIEPEALPEPFLYDSGYLQ